MTHAEIREAILTNWWQSKDDAEVKALIEVPKTVRVPFYAGLGTPMKYLGAEAGAALLEAMGTEAETNIVVKWGLKLLERGELDLSLDSTRAMLDALLPEPAASTLKALGEQVITPSVSLQQIRDSREGL